MSTSIGELVAFLGLEATEFDQGIANVDAGLKKIERGAELFAATAAAAFVAASVPVFSLVSEMEGVENAVEDMAAKLEDKLADVAAPIADSIAEILPDVQYLAEILIDAFGGPLVSAVNVATNAFGLVTDSLREMDDESVQSGVQMAAQAAGLAGVAAASIAAASKLSEVAHAFTGVNVSATKMLGSMGMVAVGVLGLITILGAAEMAWQAYSDGTTDILEAAAEAATEAANGIGESFDNALTFVRDTTLDVVDIMLKAWAKFATANEALFGESFATNLVQDASAAFSAASDEWKKTTAFENFQLALEVDAGLVSEGISRVTTAFNTGLDLVAGKLPDLASLFDDAASATDHNRIADEDEAKALAEAAATMEKWKSAMGDLISKGEETSAAFAELHQTPEQLQATFDEIDAAFADVAKQMKTEWLESIGRSVLDASGAGGIVDGAVEGAAAAGPAGAVIGGLTAVLMESEGFANLMAELSEMLAVVSNVVGGVLQALDPVIDLLSTVLAVVLSALAPILQAVSDALYSLAPLLEVLGDLVQSVSPLLQMVGEYLGLIIDVVFTLLGPALEALSAALGVVSDIIGAVVGAIAAGWNWILGAVQTIIEGIIKILPGKNQWAQDIVDSLEDAKVDTNGQTASDGYEYMLDQDSEVIATHTASMEDATDAATDVAESFYDLADSMANVPTGYKVAGVAYDAADTDLGAYAAMGTGTPEGGWGSVYVDGDIYVTADDPDSFSKALAGEVSRMGLIDGGLPVARSVGWGR